MKKLIRGLLDFQLNARPGMREVFARLAKGQHPDCLFISCADSRVVPNLLVATDPGDLFVVRNVGNLVPPSDQHGHSTGDQSEPAALEFSLRNLPSVVDVAGINQISRATLGNAVAAIAGMAKAYQARTAAAAETEHDDAPLVGASMFGLTTPAVDEARARLTELGYEVLVFHATGAGGRAMESLARDGFLAGVLDLTTTELVDDLLGGALSAGPDRLEAAGRAGLPQVVSVGALDMCNFGPREGVPDKYDDRTFVVHNPTVTLMRTTAEEMAELGRRIATKLAAATGPVEVYLPLKGVSGIDVEGAPFFDPDADAACFAAIREGLAGTDAVVHDVDAAINDPGFGRVAADKLHELITTEQ